MSIDENMEQAGFAAWAATEGITNVVFSPVTAVGRTLGNVSGQRDHHLVLLDREWGIWQAARASRPREAAVAPEACPVAWQVVSAHDGYSWGVFDRSNGGEQEATEVAKRGPYRVIPLYAQPPRATAEGGGEAKAANTNAVARAVGGLLDAWDLSDEDSVVEKVRPHMKAIHRLIERDEFYATPASAAGREGAHGPGKCLSVDAIEFDRTVASREQDERERWIREDERAKCLHAAKHSPACKGCKRVMANAIRALLAAEAAERGEEEA